MGKKLDLNFSVNGGLQLSADGFSPLLREDGDFWRAFLDTGEIRELSVYSYDQTPSHTDITDTCAVYRYDSLTAEDGVTYPISLEVTLQRVDGTVHCSAVIENHGDCIVNELQLPFVDAYDYGCGTGQTYTPAAFLDIYLHTFPGIHISNRFIHDDKPGFRDHLNYAFVYGLIFDVCIYRGRVCGIAGVPDYAEHVKYLTDLKEKYHDYFYHGRFESMFGEPVPAGIRSAKFRCGNGYLVTFWNTTDMDASFVLYGKEITVAAKDVSAAEYTE